MKNIYKMWNQIFSAPKHYELAARELETAKKEYLENKTLQEYYSTLCSFQTQRIKRLEQYLGIEHPQ